MATTKTAKIRNADYVETMATAIESTKQTELEAANLRKAQQLEEGISNDQLELLEAEEKHYLGRAEWVSKFESVLATDFDKLKTMGVSEKYIESVSKDKYATRNCSELFRTLARKDKAQLQNGRLINYVSALIMHDMDESEYIENAVMLKAVGCSTNRQHDLIRNMFARLGVIVRCKDDYEFESETTCRGSNRIKVRKTSKIYKALVKIYA